MTSAMNEQVIADATRKLAQSAIDMRQQRDDAEQALSQAYYLVTGRSPAWSDTFGHEQALEDIREAVGLLKLALKIDSDGAENPDAVIGEKRGEK